MSDVSDQAPDRFTVTYSEEELWALGKLAQRRLDHAPHINSAIRLICPAAPI
jgi:hypothetical protein